MGPRATLPDLNLNLNPNPRKRPLHVVGTPPPSSSKHKQAFVPQVIETSDAEDSAGAANFMMTLNKIKKGKSVMDASDGHLNGYCEESIDDHISISDGSNDSIDADATLHDFSSYDDDYMDDIIDDGVQVHDDYDLLQAHFDSIDVPTGVEAPIPTWLSMVGMSNAGNQSMTQGVSNPASSVSSSNPKFPQTFYASSSHPTFPQKSFSQSEHSPLHPFKTFFKDASKHPPSYSSSPSEAYISGIEPFDPDVYTLPMDNVDSQMPPGSSGANINIREVLRRFENFEQFDTVVDHSDHHYRSESSTNNPPKSWANRIQEEWKILEKDLPDTIFVRIYETRLDLLRAVIAGAEGTPYHDGLYFFDFFFPKRYPDVPPKVHYHARGLRLNPNLYSSGKVCLSLLNTWPGSNSRNEKWMPGVSTVLQVLVSIQGLILNAKPYFNEPGYEYKEGKPCNENKSVKYNEDIFILSLKTMTYVVRRPPMHFEDLVKGHFFTRSNQILAACQAYAEGTQVGCHTVGGGSVQDDRAEKKKGQLSIFRMTVASYIPILAKEFVKIGAKDRKRFLAFT